MVAFASAHQRREELQACGNGQGQHRVHDLLRALPGDRAPTVGAVGDADAGVEQAQVIVDLRDGADGGARVVGDAFLVNGDGGA